jgi:thiosulfate/3-mercaptopyruvate sulfurtransferase
MAIPLPILVSTEWLSDHLLWPDIAVFDCTGHPPRWPRVGRVGFRLAHIPRALYLDFDEVFVPVGVPPHPVPSPGRLARLLGDMGVSNRSRVVLYDQEGLTCATRGWRLLRLLGHEAVAVLDGGLPMWLGAGHPTESGEPLPPAPVLFVLDCGQEGLCRLEGL